jgi:HK97 family phage major capsid protein
MNKILELRQKRAALVTQGRELIDQADNEKRAMNADEENSYQKIMADVDAIKANIDKEERQKQLEDEMRNSLGTGVGSGGAATLETKDENRNKPVMKREEYRTAFKKYLITGMGGLDAEERKLILSGASQETRALAVGTGSAGGYTVPQGFYDQLTDAMKWFGGIRNSKATILRTAAGNALPMPTDNDTTVTGELVSENSAVSAADISFGQKILNAYKFSSKTVLVSLELLQDSAFDIEAFIAKKLGQRLGRITNTYFTTGTGTSQPQGIVTGATSGKVGATGQTTSITFDDLIDLEHSVDPAYRQNAQFMMNDSTLKAIKKLKDSYGRYLWLPGTSQNAPDTIMNYGYVINNDMASMAANAKSVLFGDLSTFYVRDVMDITLFRISEKYIENGQVGFLAFYRGDSAALDAGTHPICYYANSAT